MIYYLVQGEAYQYADRMAEMKDSGAEVIFLTWDKQIDGALFLPNSTCMQGRKFLLDHIFKNNYNFEYLVFIDGDAKPLKGSWQKFNDFLLSKKPQICIPLMQAGRLLFHDITKRLSIHLPMPVYQRALYHDSQAQAYRNDVVFAIKDFFHITLFDNISWWYNSTISQYMLKYITPHNIIQFNGLEIENNSHAIYPKEFDLQYIGNYLKKIGLNSLLPLFNFHTKFFRLRKILNSFIEIFYLIPFPIKEFDVAKRSEYVKQCLQKMEQPTEETTKNQQSCKSI